MELRTDITAWRNKSSSNNKICDDNRKPFITTFHNIHFAPDLCNRLFSIITLMNSGNTCLFHKGFFTVYFGAKENNTVSLPHSAQRKNEFLGKIKEMSKKKKLLARNKIALELLHQILGHRSITSLLAGDTANFCEGVELIIYPDPFCTS